MTVFGRIPGATALLLGTSRYATLADVPAVATTVTDLAAALVGRCGLDPLAVHVATELSGPEEMGDAIAAVTEAATGPILVSFAGHGLVSPNGLLYLATARTDARRSRLEHTALPYSTLRRYLLDSAARPVVVLLDCCFSGWALSAMGDERDEVAGLAEIDGAFVVTAAGRSEVALAPEGDRHTAFGGALLRLLENGDPDAPHDLTLQAVHRHLSWALPAAGFPRPRCRASGTAGELVLARNPASPVPIAQAQAASLGVQPAAVAPYRGLAAFDTGDGAWFFGRDRLVTQLTRRLAQRVDDPRPLVVTGASGSGKSSLLRAGLLPAIARGGLELYGSAAWSSALITPTAHPLAALDRVRGTRVIVVDQFEELFTECADEGVRREFVSRIHDLARGEALVVLCVRADFYGRCAAYPQLAVAMGDGQLVVGPMDEGELRDAIVRPAELAGLTLEPGLVELLLADLGTRYEAGRLPLLSHALLATWQRRSGAMLTVSAYRATGGIHGALAATADRTLAEVGDRRAARALMRRLVHVAEGTEDTRRRVDRDLVLADVPSAVVEGFAAERLVTVDEEYVQLTHEALIHAWPTLRAWIDEDRAGALVEQHLLDAALAWEHDHRDPSGLYRGARLALAREWATDRAPSPLSAEFLEASYFQETASARASRRRVRLLRNLAASLAALLVVTLAATGLAVRQTATAAEQRDLAAARKTAALADTLRTADPRTAMLLSVAAWRLGRVDEARAALYSSLAQREDHVLPAPKLTGSAVFTLSADGATTAALDDGRATLWEVDTGRRLATLGALDRDAVAIALSNDTRTLAVTSPQMTRLWDVTTGRPLGPAFGTGAFAVEFAPSGRLLALRTEDDLAQVWDVRDLSAPALERRDVDIIGISLSPDDRTVALLRRDGDVDLADLSRGTSRRLRTEATASAFSPDGKVLAVAQGSQVRFVSVATGEVTGRPLPSVPARWLSYSLDGRFVMVVGIGTLMVGTPGGREVLRRRVTDVPSQEYARMDATGQRLVYPLGRGAVAVLDVWPLTAPWGRDRSLVAAISADGRVAALAGADDVALWNPGQQDWAGSPLDVAGATAVELSADGTTLAVAEPQRITLWDVAQRQPTGSLPVFGAYRLVMSRDHAMLAVAVYTTDGREVTQVWDTRTRAQVPIPVTAGSGAMAFIPGTGALATGGPGNALTPLSGQPRRVRPFGAEVLAIAASSDGAMIATSDRNGRVDLWNARTMAWTGLLVPPDDVSRALSTLTFSPDGSLLAAGGEDGTVTLWRVATRFPLGLPASTHGGPVLALAFARGELHSISAEGGPQHRPVDADRAAEAVCARVGRTLPEDQWRRLIPESSPRKVC